MAKIKEKRNPFTPLTTVLLVFLCIYCLSLLYLLLWSVFTSFKVNEEVYNQNPAGFFADYRGYIAKWEGGTLKEKGYARKLKAIKEAMGGYWLLPFYSYKEMFTQFTCEAPSVFGKVGGEVGMAEMYKNSLLYAGGCAFASTFVSCIAAYACARFNYKFSRFVHTLVIVVMMIPIVGSLPSELRVAKATGVINEIWGLWIMRANFLGLYFLVFYDICKALPMSFSEAAKIDGANNFQIFFQIAMPLIKNTFMTVLLIKFIGFWNDYQAAMVFMPSYPTIALGLRKTMSPNSDSLSKFEYWLTPARMAAIVMTATPVSILFAIFQKRLLGNLTVGGVKG